MIRRQIYLTEYEVAEIQILAEKIDMPVSEYIRRILDEHIKKVQKNKNKKN